VSVVCYLVVQYRY